MAKAKTQETVDSIETFETNDGATGQGQENAPEVPESIGLNELAVLAQIVDLATQRGAFRANELTQVGAVYDKLNNFLGFIKQQQEEKEAANEDSPNDSPAETGEE